MLSMPTNKTLLPLLALLLVGCLSKTKTKDEAPSVNEPVVNYREAVTSSRTSPVTRNYGAKLVSYAFPKSCSNDKGPASESCFSQLTEALNEKSGLVKKLVGVCRFSWLKDTKQMMASFLKGLNRAHYGASIDRYSEFQVLNVSKKEAKREREAQQKCHLNLLSQASAYLKFNLKYNVEITEFIAEIALELQRKAREKAKSYTSSEDYKLQRKKLGHPPFNAKLLEYMSDKRSLVRSQKSTGNLIRLKMLKLLSNGGWSGAGDFKKFVSQHLKYKRYIVNPELKRKYYPE